MTSSATHSSPLRHQLACKMVAGGGKREQDTEGQRIWKNTLNRRRCREEGKEKTSRHRRGWSPSHSFLYLSLPLHFPACSVEQSKALRPLRAHHVTDAAYNASTLAVTLMVIRDQCMYTSSDSWLWPAASSPPHWWRLTTNATYWRAAQIAPQWAVESPGYGTDTADAATTDSAGAASARGQWLLVRHKHERNSFPQLPACLHNIAQGRCKICFTAFTSRPIKRHSNKSTTSKVLH